MDYKYAIQMMAEELAEQAGEDYHKLPLERQCELHKSATELYWERGANVRPWLGTTA